MTNVRLEQIAKSYQAGKPVLKPFDLTVEAGELFFLLGPSGCGKSTLLRILAGLLKPDSGKILFNDTDVTDFAPEKRQAAMVFQSYALWPHLTVFENVAFGLRAARASSKVIKEEVTRALEIVHLADCADRKVPSLSGGQQQRVALARALAVQPKVLLLDEPLSNLDARLRDEMRVEIRRIVKERKLTALYVTHDRREALSMADRIAVLNQGILQQTGSPEEVYGRPANRFVATFLGDGNFLDGICKSEKGVLKVTTAVGTFQPADAGSFMDGDKVTLLLRPECIRFTDAAGDNTFAAQLKNGVFLGDHREWFCQAGDNALTINESAASRRDSGEYRLAVAPEHVVVLKQEC
ncbi:MAG: ABC transporter ATP-binding protein [Lentisphaeria bacterium]|nr:ABC transporter ATP-binding protein [Lentisphaeria bacterium]